MGIGAQWEHSFSWDILEEKPTYLRAYCKVSLGCRLAGLPESCLYLQHKLHYDFFFFAIF